MQNTKTRRSSTSIWTTISLVLIPGLVLGAVLSINGCECACTSMACSTTLELTIRAEDGGPLEVGEYRVEWEMDGASGAFIGEVEIGDTDDLYFFTGEYYAAGDIAEEPSYEQLENGEEITFTVFFGEVELLRQTYELVHSEAVCNECSGGPWCDADMYVAVEPITIELPL